MKHYQIAEMCQQSYAEADGSVNDIEFVVRDTGNVQYVVFRGTETSLKNGGWKDMLRDVFFIPYCTHGLVGHAGFLSGARVVCNKIAPMLDDTKPVIVAGHSLGGAIAVGVTRILRAWGYLVTNLVTFGAPTVISKGHEYYEGIKVTQYEYGDDIVPTVQFWTPRKHIDRTQIGPIRRKPIILYRTWKDHAIEHYILTLRGFNV